MKAETTKELAKRLSVLYTKNTLTKEDKKELENIPQELGKRSSEFITKFCRETNSIFVPSNPNSIEISRQETENYWISAMSELGYENDFIVEIPEFEKSFGKIDRGYKKNILLFNIFKRKLPGHYDSRHDELMGDITKYFYTRNAGIKQFHTFSQARDIIYNCIKYKLMEFQSSACFATHYFLGRDYNTVYYFFLFRTEGEEKLYKIVNGSYDYLDAAIIDL